MNYDSFFTKFPQIDTSHLILREINENDAAGIIKVFSSEETAKFYNMQPVKTAEKAQELITTFSAAYMFRRSLQWGIIWRPNGEFLGTCGFHGWVPPQFRTEITFDIAKEYSNKGILDEALLGLVKFGFDKFGLNRIESKCLPSNTEAIRLLKKLGFTEEGKLREQWYCDGKFYDMIMFSLLKKEYNKN